MLRSERQMLNPGVKRPWASCIRSNSVLRADRISPLESDPHTVITYYHILSAKPTDVKTAHANKPNHICTLSKGHSLCTPKFLTSKIMHVTTKLGLRGPVITCHHSKGFEERSVLSVWYRVAQGRWWNMTLAVERVGWPGSICSNMQQ